MLYLHKVFYLFSEACSESEKAKLKPKKLARLELSALQEGARRLSVLLDKSE